MDKHQDELYKAVVEARDANIHNGNYVTAEWDSIKECRRNAKRQKKEQRHEEREERRKEMEHVPKNYWDEWDQERADDI